MNQFMRTLKAAQDEIDCASDWAKIENKKPDDLQIVHLPVSTLNAIREFIKKYEQIYGVRPE